MVERELAREIRKACGSGERAAKMKLLGAVRGVQERMSSLECAKDPRGAMRAAIREHGRAAWALCLAATIVTARQDWVNSKTMAWAREVIGLWSCRPMDIGQVAYNDRLHPSRLAEYAGDFIRTLTEVE